MLDYLRLFAVTSTTVAGVVTVVAATVIVAIKPHYVETSK